MKKILLLAGVATALFATESNAFEINPYLSGKVTYSHAMHNITFVNASGAQHAKFNDNIFGGNVAVGVKMMNMIRTEIEFGMKQNAEKSIFGSGNAEVSNKALMFNAYYDMPFWGNIVPYIGGGLGMSFLEAKNHDENASFSNKATKFTWQIGGGIAYSFTENWAIDAGYRYSDAGEFKDSNYGEEVKAKAKYHEFMLGVRYTF